MVELITDEMVEHFKYRTGYHLWCVRKWSDRIAKYCGKQNVYKVRISDLDKERDRHDEFKWVEPEYTPYVILSWKYRCKRAGVEFALPDDIAAKIREATFHHIKRHRHHPEFWDVDVTIDALNPADRDKPSGRIVDGTKMPPTYVAAMCADWFAMSEEKGTCPFDWAKDNINIRWKFTNPQVDLIYKLLKEVWEKHNARSRVERANSKS